MDLAEYYEEVTKTAGLNPEVETDEEKVAAVAAVAEQFDIDGIEFDSEDEKIAAAVAIVEGFEQATEEDPEKIAKSKLLQRARLAYKAARGKVKAAYGKTKEHISKHKGKYGLGAGAAVGLGGGYALGRSRD